MVMRMISSRLVPAVSTNPLLTTGMDGTRDNNVFCSNTENSKISQANKPGIFTKCNSDRLFKIVILFTVKDTLKQQEIFCPFRLLQGSVAQMGSWQLEYIAEMLILDFCVLERPSLSIKQNCRKQELESQLQWLLQRIGQLVEVLQYMMAF